MVQLGTILVQCDIIRNLFGAVWYSFDSIYLINFPIGIHYFFIHSEKDNTNNMNN